MSKCARSGCTKSGVFKCSDCLKEGYCSGDCQKVDWKISHESICKTLKRLSYDFQPYYKVVHVIEEIQKETPKKKQLDVRFLGQLISYTEHQFGNRVPSRSYRERGNDLINVYSGDESLSMIVRDNLSFPLWEKVLDLLRPWSVCLDFSSTSTTDSLKRNKINLIVSQTEGNVAAIHIRRDQLDLAENHCRRALSYARQYEGEEEEMANLLCRALRTCYELQSFQGNYDDALTFAEESYNCAAVAYNPVHPKVQEAASMLIECLFFKGNFENAETFAEMTLESLKDPKDGLDQQSEEVAQGYYDLANVLSKQQKTFVKAEMLVRESRRIRVQLYGNDHPYVGYCSHLLARILQLQNQLGHETKELFERSLAINIANYGHNGINTAVANGNLGGFYHQLADTQKIAGTRKNYLRLSKSYLKEVLRISTKIFGAGHPDAIRAASDFTHIACKLSEA